MQDARPEAERRVTQHPYPSLPDALMAVVAEQHTSVTRQEAEAFLAGHESRPVLKSAFIIATPVSAAPAKPTRRKAAAGKKPGLPTQASQAILSETAISPKPAPQAVAGEKFTLTQGALQATAHLQPNGELLVLAGSRAAAVVANSLTASRLPLRQELLDKGILATEGDYLIFTQDFRFKSANIAAEIIVARSVNAQLAWQHTNGQQVRDFLTKA